MRPLFLVQQDVRGFDVAVHNPLPVTAI
jgi:hypothetical protein